MLHVFDMDGTLLPGTTASRELARELGVTDELLSLEEEFALGRIDSRGFARAIYTLWGSVSEEVSARAFATAPKLQSIRRVLADLHSKNHCAIVITLSPDFFARRFASFGFDYVFASTFPTGTETAVDPQKILRPDDKPLLVEDLCRRQRWENPVIIAYGDSLSDRAMFERAAVSVAVNGDAHVQSLATCQYTGNDLWAAYEMALDAVAAKRAN